MNTLLDVGPIKNLKNDLNAEASIIKGVASKEESRDKCETRLEAFFGGTLRENFLLVFFFFLPDRRGGFMEAKTSASEVEMGEAAFVVFSFESGKASFVAFLFVAKEAALVFRLVAADSTGFEFKLAAKELDLRENCWSISVLSFVFVKWKKIC